MHMYVSARHKNEQTPKEEKEDWKAWALCKDSCRLCKASCSLENWQVPAVSPLCGRIGSRQAESGNFKSGLWNYFFLTSKSVGLMLKKKHLHKNWQKALFPLLPRHRGFQSPGALEIPPSLWQPRGFFLSCTVIANRSLRGDPWSRTAPENCKSYSRGGLEGQLLPDVWSSNPEGNPASLFCVCAPGRHHHSFSPRWLHKHKHTHAHRHTCTGMQMYTDTHMHMYTYAHVHMCAHSHTCTAHIFPAGCSTCPVPVNNLVSSNCSRPRWYPPLDPLRCAFDPCNILY